MMKKLVEALFGKKPAGSWVLVLVAVFVFGVFVGYQWVWKWQVDEQSPVSPIQYKEVESQPDKPGLSPGDWPVSPGPGPGEVKRTVHIVKPKKEYEAFQRPEMLGVRVDAKGDPDGLEVELDGWSVTQKLQPADAEGVRWLDKKTAGVSLGDSSAKYLMHAFAPPIDTSSFSGSTEHERHFRPPPIKITADLENVKNTHDQFWMSCWETKALTVNLPTQVGCPGWVFRIWPAEAVEVGDSDPGEKLLHNATANTHVFSYRFSINEQIFVHEMKKTVIDGLYLKSEWSGKPVDIVFQHIEVDAYYYEPDTFEFIVVLPPNG